MEFRLHGALLHRGLCRGERFPFEIPVSAMFLSAVNPPRKKWRIGRLRYCGRYIVLRLSVGGDRCAVCLYRRGGLSVKVSVFVGGLRHSHNSTFFTAGLLAVLPPL
ncbi:hypothetical protein NDU88_005199 [Pleurodeles waltl]|uniref:Uncharacterized protein n=1 Tax=Pleurodeles waltl TaxID=8319 RepID=A0AAV7N546_PLEWA|nr:hypothetical protein NDU88_005199 [Pleurodeles waltl]